MGRNNVLRWRDGRGWLVLSGGTDEASDVHARAVGRLSADGGVAYVTFGSHIAEAESALTDLEDLGAPSGYLVDLFAEDDETIQRHLAEAGMVVISVEADPQEVRSALLGAAVQGLLIAYENGAVILVEGSSAAVFGEWLVLPDGSIRPGLDWAQGMAVFPGIVAAAEAPSVRQFLEAQPAGIAVGIGVGSALALGPDGEVETWGLRQVTIALGPRFTG
ncbi:MAG: hypothetical protein JNM70_11070 [Anaerolineae bacterium]|nr:hypothetical protein [Anaerolineae bacterium]